MLYPQNLIYVNLFDALHRDKSEMKQKKRFKVFWLIVVFIFVYEWLPEYIAPTLGAFNIVCLAARNTEWVSYVSSLSSSQTPWISLCPRYSAVRSLTRAWACLALASTGRTSPRHPFTCPFRRRSRSTSAGR
jgi:hypothetical protein